MIVETPDFDPKNNKTGYLLKSKMRLFKRAWKLIVKLLLPVNSVDGKDILICHQIQTIFLRIGIVSFVAETGVSKMIGGKRFLPREVS